ncbi:MAG: peptidyl-prolyl cis-trans isomerase [Sandaracinaceae bacterium]|nr:peptidyl-prolyl cis-trans isomerase [Sandaracinaceae bacterium]
MSHTMARAFLWLGLAALSGCESCHGDPPPTHVEEAPGDRSTDPALTLGLAPEVAQRTIAHVDGEPVRVLDVAFELDSLSPIAAARSVDATRRQALAEALVLDRALAAEARDRGLGESPRVRAAREDILTRAIVAQLERDVPAPSDADVRAYYDAHRERYRAPELRNADLIFTRDGAAATTALGAMVHEVRRLSELWIQTADRIGFAGPRRQARTITDMIGATPRPGEVFVPQPVRDAIFATEPGAVYPELIPFEDGFFLVSVLSRAEPTDTPFESVRVAIREQLHAEAIDARLTEVVASSLATATYDDDALAAVRVPAAEGPALVDHDVDRGSDEDVDPASDEDVDPASDEDVDPASDEDVNPASDEDVSPRR